MCTRALFLSLQKPSFSPSSDLYACVREKGSRRGGRWLKGKKFTVLKSREKLLCPAGRYPLPVRAGFVNFLPPLTPRWHLTLRHLFLSSVSFFIIEPPPAPPDLPSFFTIPPNFSPNEPSSQWKGHGILTRREHRGGKNKKKKKKKKKKKTKARKLSLLFLLLFFFFFREVSDIRTRDEGWLSGGHVQFDLLTYGGAALGAKCIWGKNNTIYT